MVSIRPLDIRKGRCMLINVSNKEQTYQSFMMTLYISFQTSSAESSTGPCGAHRKAWQTTGPHVCGSGQPPADWHSAHSGSSIRPPSSGAGDWCATIPAQWATVHWAWWDSTKVPQRQSVWICHGGTMGVWRTCVWISGGGLWRRLRCRASGKDGS